MEYIKMEHRGRVAVVTINRPDALNALNGVILEELRWAFSTIAGDASVRAVVLTGEGKAFVAGADIVEMVEFSKWEALSWAESCCDVFSVIERTPQPVIAAINGYALGGGCELALVCDIRLASEKAKFGQPETTLGITPGFGGTQRLPRIIGMSNAMEWIFTGKIVDAMEALRVGLVSAVHPQESLLEEAVKLATAIARNAPVAVQAAKSAVRQGAELSLEAAIPIENALFSECFDTDDQREAMQAFIEKRSPTEFRGV